MLKMNTKKLLYLALFLATELVLSRFLSIQTPIVKIGFAFLPIAMSAVMFGPFWAAACAGCADFLGAILFPVGPYFPGFTLTAILTGLVYGIFLYKNSSWARVIIAVLIISLVLNLCLDTLWLHMLFGESYFVLLPTRILKSVIMAPVQILVVRLVVTRLKLATRRMA